MCGGEIRDAKGRLPGLVGEKFPLTQPQFQSPWSTPPAGQRVSRGSRGPPTLRPLRTAPGSPGQRGGCQAWLLCLRNETSPTRARSMTRETTQTGNWACPFVNSSSGPRWDLRPPSCPVKSLGPCPLCQMFTHPLGFLRSPHRR